MAGINTGKVVVGGLVAGLVFNVGDMVSNAVILAEDYRQAVSSLGLDPARMETLAGVLPWIVIDFVYGLLVVWTYAAIRPRCGPGPKTALAAGMIILTSFMLLFTGFTTMGIFPAALYFKQLVFSIIFVSLGSLAGARVYSEA